MRKYLNGEWKLFFADNVSDDSGSLTATVPGNVELDLSKAGYLPEDLMFGNNIEQAEKYETYDFTYATTFDCEDNDTPHRIVFEGVDCYAEYYVNGEKIGESDNMLIAHSFLLPPLKKTGNGLVVKIRSTFVTDSERDYPVRIGAGNWGSNVSEPAYARRAAHTYGWDIMPRAVSAGIWKDVYVEPVPKTEFSQLYIATERVSEKEAGLYFYYEIKSDCVINRRSGYTLEIAGECGDSRFSKYAPVSYKCGFTTVAVPSPRLWWCRGYGDSSLYTVTVTLKKNGETVAERTERIGIRTLKLEYTETGFGGNGEFGFTLNGERIFALGTNWVPLSPYHSQDKARTPEAMRLLGESRVNTVRCWGGNVYESDEFYDYCDENGILVWQDFGVGCTKTPEDRAYLDRIQAEAQFVVRRLRNRACVALWSGDNEVDAMYNSQGYDPSQNVLTRQVFPQAVRDNDRFRSYLPSSPYISKEARRLGGDGKAAERHLWGAREFFKSAFYRDNDAIFVSETGYHGCIERASAEQFMPKSELDDRHAYNWTLHSTDTFGNDHRVRLMERQIRYMFGDCPNGFDEFSELSQYVQAEAYKFFIENMRIKSYGRGIIWWNLLDGWPQYSDAVVDFYFRKKKAFFETVRSSQPFVMMVGESNDGRLRLYARNDTRKSKTTPYRVYDADTGETLAEGSVEVTAGKRVEARILPHTYSEKRLLIIEWEGGKNYFITGSPTYEVSTFRAWRKIIDTL